MSKKVVILITLGIIMTLVGCTPSQSANESEGIELTSTPIIVETKEVSIEDEAAIKEEIVDEADADIKEEFIEEEMVADNEPDYIIPELDDTVIVDQNDILIATQGFEHDADYNQLGLNLLVENNSDKDISLNLGYIIINGYQMGDVFLFGDVEAGEKYDAKIYIAYEELKICSIEEIADIQMAIEVNDATSWDTIFITDPIKLKTNSEYVQTYDDSGTVLIDNADTKIVYKEIISTAYSPQIVLYLENKRNEELLVNTLSVAVNGYQINDFHSRCELKPELKMVVTLDISGSELTICDIEEIVDVEIVYGINQVIGNSVVDWYKTDPVLIKTGSTYVQSYDDSGTVIADVDGIKIIYKEFVNNGEYDTYALFYIENNSAQKLTIEKDILLVNGIEFNNSDVFVLDMHAEIEAGKKSFVKQDFLSEKLEEKGISTMDSIDISIKASAGMRSLFSTELISLPIN